MCNSLEEEHGQVSRELDRLPRQADVDARLQDLNRQLDDLRDEIRKVDTMHMLWLVLDFPVPVAFQRYSTLQWGAGISWTQAVFYSEEHCE